jgi:hypothetical protein
MRKGYSLPTLGGKEFYTYKNFSILGLKPTKSKKGLYRLGVVHHYLNGSKES